MKQFFKPFFFRVQDSLAHAHRTILAMPPAPLGRYLPPARHPPREVAAMDSYIDFLRKASNAVRVEYRTS